MFAMLYEDGIQFWDIANLRPIGPKVLIEDVRSLAFHPSGEQLAVGTHWRGVILVPVPPPVDANLERIRLWIEVATGRELDAGGALLDLDAKTWRERYDRLQKLGGPPTP